MTSSLVGSEMCIRDSSSRSATDTAVPGAAPRRRSPGRCCSTPVFSRACLLYTSTLPTICSV
eukprot:6924976-Prorocentrum_lima.AAC.1